MMFSFYQMKTIGCNIQKGLEENKLPLHPNYCHTGPTESIHCLLSSKHQLPLSSSWSPITDQALSPQARWKSQILVNVCLYLYFQSLIVWIHAPGPNVLFHLEAQLEIVNWIKKFPLKRNRKATRHATTLWEALAQASAVNRISNWWGVCRAVRVSLSKGFDLTFIHFSAGMAESLSTGISVGWKANNTLCQWPRSTPSTPFLTMHFIHLIRFKTYQKLPHHVLCLHLINA